MKRLALRPSSWSAALGLAIALAGPRPSLAAPADPWQPVPGTLLTPHGRTVSPTNAHSEYPRPQMVRADWLNLNGLWDYAITTGVTSTPDRFEGRILVPFPVESGLSGVGRRLWETNVLWYRRTFQVPLSWAGRRVLLHFGAVDWHTRVRINGNEIGQHRGGYDPFSFDITPWLKFTNSGPEEIVVAVQDPTEADQPRGKQSRNPEGIFYTPSSGIWQTVWLEPAPAARINQLLMTTDPEGRLRLTVRANRSGELLRVEAVALREGQPVAHGSGVPNTEVELRISDPRLWSPNDPFLYDLRVTLLREEDTIDVVDSYFALRSFEVHRDPSGAPRLALNGEPLFQMGILDQGFWPDGLYTAPADSAWREELATVKRLGFNTVRKHVKVEPDRWYYWCDRLGLMVWQDMPSGNNRTASGRRQFEIEVQRMIENLSSHPSIGLWVLFNEGWGQYDTARLTDWIRTLDPSRLVNSASGWIDKNCGDTVDVHSYPGPEAPATESSRAAVLGEFGGVALAITNHLWSPRNWGYENVRTTGDLTARYTELLTHVWNLNDVGGLSAAIYTQLSDVETECNGLLTYDRAVLKVDPDAARTATRGESRPPPVRLLMPTAEFGRSSWRYSLVRPGPRWTLRRYDVAHWSRGLAGFGVISTSPGQQPARTAWTSPQIWLRRVFVLSDWQGGRKAHLRVRHAADADIYLNGTLAASVTGQSAGYATVPLSSEAAAALEQGLNVIAVHARRTVTNQFIDVGLVSPVPGRPEPGE